MANTPNDTRLALCDARGPLNDLMEKLGGAEGESWLNALKRLLRKEENPWKANPALPVCHIFNAERFFNGERKVSDYDRISDTFRLINWHWLDFSSCSTLLTYEENLRQMKGRVGIFLGGNAFYSLWLDYQDMGKDSVLEWLHIRYGVCNLCFFGLILLNVNTENQEVLLLCRIGESKWEWRTATLNSCPESDYTIPSVRREQLMWLV